MGAHGVVSGVACAVPELMVAIEAAVTAAAPDRNRIESLDLRVREFVERIAAFPAPMGIMEAARSRGIRAGATAIDLSGDERERMEQFLNRRKG